MSSASSLRTKVIKGAVWMVASRWSQRLLGLASTMVLARLLSPSDFGTVAIVMSLVTILDAFFDFGFDMALIKDRNSGREAFDAAWTFRLIKTWTFGLSIIALSPLVARYSSTPEAVAISVVIGAGMALRGFENIGIVHFLKDLEFDGMFRVRFYPRLLGVITTIALALVLRSYWAIVYGYLANAIYCVIFSYTLNAYRPRIRFKGILEFWGFARWALLLNFNRQVFAAADRFLMSAWIPKPALGRYTVAADLSGVLTNEIFSPVGSALMPGYAQLQDSRGALRAAFVNSLTVFIALALPVSFGVWLVAPEVVRIVLGWQWGEAARSVSLFALVFLALSISEMLAGFMAMVGLITRTAVIGLIKTGIFLAAVYFAFDYDGVYGVIVLKIALASLEALVLYFAAAKFLDLPDGSLVSIIWRPTLATALMVVVVSWIDAQVNINALIELAFKGSVGVLIYTCTMLLLWCVAGKPAGVETTLIDFVGPRLSPALRRIIEGCKLRPRT